MIFLWLKKKLNYKGYNEDLRDTVNLNYFLNLRKDIEDALREVMAKDPRRTPKGKEGRELYRQNIDLLRTRWINTGLFPHEDHDYFSVCSRIEKEKRLNHYSCLDTNPLPFLFLSSGNKKSLKGTNHFSNDHINSVWLQYVRFKSTNRDLFNDAIIIVILLLISELFRN